MDDLKKQTVATRVSLSYRVCGNGNLKMPGILRILGALGKIRTERAIDGSNQNKSSRGLGPG